MSLIPQLKKKTAVDWVTIIYILRRKLVSDRKCDYRLSSQAMK